jgi:uracil-DNA glycosylase
MSLDLDERQRAMLEAMHIKLWLPQEQAAQELAVAAAPAPPAAAAPAAQPQRAYAPPVHAPAAPRQPVAIAPRPEGIESMDWAALQEAVSGCQACQLCNSRRNTVFGVGPQAEAGAVPQVDWLIVGEPPGEDEDLQGEPFVGAAGQLLDNMLKAVQRGRSKNVYIASVLKCRPPGNRNPEPGEMAQCEHFLRRQVELLQPRLILAMGRFAVQALLQSAEPIGKLRGRAHQYGGVPLVVTYHPAYLLRNLPDKAKAWADLCLAQALDGAPLPQ